MTTFSVRRFRNAIGILITGLLMSGCGEVDLTTDKRYEFASLVGHCFLLLHDSELQESGGGNYLWLSANIVTSRSEVLQTAEEYRKALAEHHPTALASGTVIMVESASTNYFISDFTFGQIMSGPLVGKKVEISGFFHAEVTGDRKLPYIITAPDPRYFAPYEFPPVGH